MNNNIYFKCYQSDVGLLVTQTFVNKPFVDNEIYKAILFDKLNVNEGMIMENYVAQTLKSKGYEMLVSYVQFHCGMQPALSLHNLPIKW